MPTVEPVAAETVLEKAPVPVTVKLPEAAVPVVLKFSLPKSIAPLESVMLPSSNVKVPTVEPVAAETVLEKDPVVAPESAPLLNVAVPSVKEPPVTAPLAVTVEPSNVPLSILTLVND